MNTICNILDTPGPTAVLLEYWNMAEICLSVGNIRSSGHIYEVLTFWGVSINEYTSILYRRSNATSTKSPTVLLY